MSFVTIQCRLVVSESIRCQLWNLMANKNTPLVSELLKCVSQHDEFEAWQRSGKVPVKTVRELGEPFKMDSRFEGQPGRFYTSASLMVAYTYKSWLALQRQRRQRLDGKLRWLNIVKSDAQLVQDSGCDLDTIRTKAGEILAHLNAQASPEPPRSTKQKRKKKKQQSLAADPRLMNLLFQAYEAMEDTLSRCAIAHLLKNDCQVSAQQEDPEAFTQRIHRKKKEIERLQAQLLSRLPKGRDLTGERFLESLAIAVGKVPDDAIEQLLWQAKLLAKRAAMPYPILFGSQDDLRWSINERGRICVAFNGLDKAIPELKRNPCQIYCDRRQLPLFQRFLADWQTFQANQDTYPLGLFLFQTGLLGWEEGQGKGEPWSVNRLTLHCTLDTHPLTAEGTEQLRQAEIARLTEKLSAVQNPEALTQNQQAWLKRQHSTLARLQNPPQRPSKLVYQGDPEILLGISIGLAHPATAAVVNVRTGKVLEYRTTRQLLGKNYRLLNRQRQQQQLHALQRHKHQIKGRTSQLGESELGQYVDRLLAKSIVELAHQFQASCIVLPQTNNLREHLAAEISARAEQKSDSKQAQDKYAKQFRISIHRWSYARLLMTIRHQAEKAGISIETGSQPLRGTSNKKAKELAIATYHLRQVACN
jgi:IS605 OrfB family transposase